MPSSSRSSLLRAALRVLGPCALPASTSVLLAHALSAYDPEGEVPTPTQGGEGPQGGLILLSRSSQRKASRLLKSSQPEELFRLAMDSILTQSGEVSLLLEQIRLKCNMLYSIPVDTAAIMNFLTACTIPSALPMYLNFARDIYAYVFLDAIAPCNCELHVDAIAD